MHVRGKSFRFTLHSPRKPPIIIADIPRYDFNWQHIYEFEQPLAVNEDTKIECLAHFDNSSANLVNPDPEVTVRWGDQTWEEMCIAFFEIAVPVGDEFLETNKNRSIPTDEELELARKKADAFFARFDLDDNQQVVREEVPKTLAVFAFGRMDEDGNGVLTRAEAQQAALDSLRQGELPF